MVITFICYSIAWVIICAIISCASYINGMNFGRDCQGRSQGFEDGWDACKESYLEISEKGGVSNESIQTPED